MNIVRKYLLNLRVLILFSLFGMHSPLVLRSQEAKVMNRPYIDKKIWHYGFLFGVHTQDIEIANNGFRYDNNGIEEQWFADIPNYSLGFTVGVLGELRINEYLSIRFIPTLHFGDKNLTFRDINSGKTVSQVIKSTYLSVPVDLKISAPRYNNFRPYVMFGLNPNIDLTVRKQREILVKRSDLFFETGLGMDLYYPYFKLIPELKFCFGLSDILVKNRTDLTDVTMLKYTHSLESMSNRMIVLTLYFE